MFTVDGVDVVECGKSGGGNSTYLHAVQSDAHLIICSRSVNISVCTCVFWMWIL